jgi:hypothetical protein
MFFWAGGHFISGVTHTQRTLAEMEGIGLGVVFIGFGAIAREAASRFDDDDENSGLRE